MFLTKILKLTLPALMFITTAGIVTSCADEEWASNNHRLVQEGIPVTINLNFCAEDNRAETRAAQNSANEGRIYNMAVFIFDKDGNRHFYQYYEEKDQGIHFENGSNYQKGSVILETTSLNNATIVCVANLSSDGVHTDYNVTQEQIKNIKVLEDLKNLEVTLENEDYERSTQFFMTGYGYETDEAGNKVTPESTTITIPDNLVEQKIYCILCPRRMDAKVTFKVIPERSKWTNLDFKPRTWRVVNVPKQAPLLQPDDPTKHISDTKTDEAYFNTKATSFEVEERETGESSRLNNCGFTFYMPESRLEPKKNISLDNLSGTKEEIAKAAYALREKRTAGEDGNYPDKPGQIYENGAFTYAADHAAYVEMTGTLSYTIPAGTVDNNIVYPTDYTVNADVTLTVHLGYDEENPNDYRTLRNTHYTYTVSLRGLDNVVVEVTNDGDKREEPRPGYEADVVFSASDVYESDAHYERQLITIDLDKIDQLTWGVQTPYTQGIYNIKNYKEENIIDPKDANLYDYKWIKFAINKDYKVNETDYVKYPGDQNYNNGIEGGGEASPYYSISGKYHADNADSETEQARMYDIHGLLKRLKKDKEDGATGTVAITAFIDEYVYFTHPIDGTTGDAMLKRWYEYVNVEDRLMYFVNGANSQYSPDGNSSIVEAVKTFRQCPIRTIYDTTKKLDSAWGTESTINSDRLAPGNITAGTSLSNGRLNTINSIITEGVDRRWSEVLNVSFRDHSDEAMLKSPYQDAFHAMLTRNRDLDGDDIVDANEIRWYLAAKNQLIDLYIGEPALDSDARLYPSDETLLVNGHWIYTSSSYDNTEGKEGPWVYWSEECAAVGNYNWRDKNGAYAIMGNKFPYRCLRNLGLKLEEIDKEPVALIPIAEIQSDGTYIIDCSNLSEEARRTSFEASSSLGIHDDLSPQNRPYAKFRVTKADKEGVYPVPNCEWDLWNPSWNQHGWTYFQTQNPTNGYRTPNLRELLIMATRLPEGAWTKSVYSKSGWFDSTMDLYYMTMTKFSRGGESRSEGFRLNPREMSFGAIPNGEGNGYVRPVQDVQ